MTRTTNNIFIDSSILIEALKGNKVDFYQSLVADNDNQFFINDTVLSEYLYYLIGFSSGTSPRTVQQKNEIAVVLTQEKHQTKVLSYFQFLKGDNTFIHEVPRLMSEYNLLPNDAIIIATCRLHGITKLASHDSDFVIPCRKENMELLTG